MDTSEFILEHAVAPLLRTLKSDIRHQDRLFTPTQFLDISNRVLSVRTLSEMRRLRELVMKAVQQFISTTTIDQVDAMRSIIDWWSRVRLLARWLSHLFSVIDRDSRGSPTLSFSVYNTFLSHIIPFVSSIMSNAFDSERTTGHTDQQNRALISQMHQMIIFINSFERQASWNDEPLSRKLITYTNTMEHTYISGAKSWLEQQCSSLSPLHMERSFQLERQRCISSMHPSTLSRLDKEWFFSIVRPRMPTLLHANIHSLFDPSSLPIASSLWLLSLSSDSIHVLASSFSSDVSSRISSFFSSTTSTPATSVALAASGTLTAGKQAVTKQAEFALGVVRMYGEALELIEKVLDGNVIVRNSLNDTMAECVNKMSIGGESMEHCLATMLEGQMASKDSSKIIKTAAALVSILSAKDTFAEHHRRMMASRLIKKRSIENEQQFVSELKMHNGVTFVQKMEAMIGDIRRSEDDDFQPPKHLPQMTATVLSHGSWPSFRTIEIRNLPMEIRALDSAYSTWYKAKNPSRVLSWSSVFSTVDVSINMPRFRGVATMCMTQACIIFEFNSDDTLSFERLRDRLELPIDVLKKALHAFVYSPKKLLLRIPSSSPSTTPSSSIIEESDSFTINHSFSSRELRFFQPCAPLETTSSSSSDMEKSILQQRTIQLEAAIVRIMKARQRITISHITQEVISQIRQFAPTQKMIKETIETLIDREYIERDQTDQSILLYC